MAERALKPDKLDLESSDPDSTKKFKHWKRCLNSFIKCIDSKEKPVDKLDILIQSVSYAVYETVEEAETFDDAIEILQGLYVKETNLLFA